MNPNIGIQGLGGLQVWLVPTVDLYPQKVQAGTIRTTTIEAGVPQSARVDVADL